MVFATASGSVLAPETLWIRALSANTSPEYFGSRTRYPPARRTFPGADKAEGVKDMIFVSCEGESCSCRVSRSWELKSELGVAMAGQPAAEELESN